MVSTVTNVLVVITVIFPMFTLVEIETNRIFPAYINIKVATNRIVAVNTKKL